MFIRNLVAAAATVIMASSAVAGTAIVMPSGGEAALSPATGAVDNPYLLDTLGVDFATVQVSVLGSGSSTEYATFSMFAPSTTVLGTANGSDLVLSLDPVGSVSGLGVTVISGTPLPPLVQQGGSYPAGSFGLQLSPGPYFLRFDGTVSDIGGPILAGLSAGLDQSETYAMMLAGLGAVSFVGWRRRHTV